MKKANTKFQKQLNQYKLKDYEFLEDYEIIEGGNSDKYIFTAKIKNTNQKVRFIKKRYSDEYFLRFKALHKLYKNGVVLADNMFIVQQCEELFFYIIQAQIEVSNSRFQTLQQYFYTNTVDQQEIKSMVIKIKILFDCLHQETQYYAGLNTTNIIIDDQKNVFLTPFSLDIQLKKDSFNRAYYPIQIIEKINKEDLQVNENILLKWDVWSFGCIIAEIVLYHSPIFLTTSAGNQIKMMNSFEPQKQTEGLEQNLKYLIINSLNRDLTKRNINIHKIQVQQQESLNKTIKKHSKNCKKILPILNDKQQEGTQQMNLNLDEQQGDSQLIFQLCSLQSIKIETQLHITIHLQRKYHFYIDSKPEQDKYLINKKITIKNNFEKFNQLLNKPVLVELKEGKQNSQIYINLQTLIMLSQGKRVWNKKLLGRYKAQGQGHFSKSKLRICCELKSPQVFIQQKVNQKRFDTSIQSQIDNNTFTQNSQETLIRQLVFPKQTIQKQQNVLAQITNNQEVKKKKKKTNKLYQQIPSISQISNTISSITQQFKKKLKIKTENPLDKAEKNNEIQISLQKMLNINNQNLLQT